MRAAIPALLAILFAWLLPGGAPSGQILVPLTNPRVALGGSAEADWLPTVEGERIGPLALDVSSSGSIWGISAERRRLFEAAGVGRPARFAGGEGSGWLGLPDRLFARSGLKVFSLDSWEGVVERFDLRGSRESRLDLREVCAAAGEVLTRAADFCLSPSGELCVLDADRRRVLIIDDRGAYRRALGESEGVRLRSPVAIDIDGHGRLYLLESEGPALVRIDVDGRVLRRDLALPADSQFLAGLLAVDAWGNAFVGDRRSGRVIGVPADGDPLWWAPGPAARGTVDDLAVDPSGRLLIAAAGSSRVRILRLLYRPESPAAGGAAGGR